jgi:hypothetical protein
MGNRPDTDTEAYVPAYPAEELDAATYAALSARPVSRAALSAVEELTELVLAKAGERSTRTRRQALGALLADLVERDEEDHGGWLYLSMDPGAFSGEAIGYRPFKMVYDALRVKFIEQVRGNRVWTPSLLAASGRTPSWQRATRFRASPALRQWLAAKGIARDEWSSHFERIASGPISSARFLPVVLRAGKPPAHFGKAKARKIPISRSDPKVAEIAGRMDRINAYFAGVKAEPFGDVVLRRIFAQGDDPAHAWSQGGRMYAIGPTPYQTAKREKRAGITINGKPTVELDIQASHLTILAGLGYVPRFTGDPYEIEGLPRSVVKHWVNMTLSHGKRHRTWPQGAVEDFLRKGIDLKTDYPIKTTGDTILRHLPVLREGGSGVAVGWGELQFRESEVVLATMEELAFEHNVPALPVHDSLIVPKSAKELATAQLRASFERSFGVVAVIT